MSPVVLPPVSTPYCSLSRAPPPDSVMNHPVIVRLLVVLAAVLESVSKFWVDAAPSVVRETHCARIGDVNRQQDSAAKRISARRMAVPLRGRDSSRLQESGGR